MLGFKSSDSIGKVLTSKTWDRQVVGGMFKASGCGLFYQGII